jgi:hypothetical protein
MTMTALSFSYEEEQWNGRNGIREAINRSSAKQLDARAQRPS